MTDVTAQQFQTDVNDVSEWNNGDVNHTQTFRLGQTADSPAKLINDINTRGNAAIDELNRSRGFTVVGTFAAGFTYELPNDVGMDASGNSWVLSNPDNLPFTVPAGTAPTSPVYKQVTFSDLQSLTGLDDSSGLNSTLPRTVSTATAIADNPSIGIRYRLTDRRSVEFVTVAQSDTGGIYLTDPALTNKLRLIPILGMLPTYGVADFSGVTDVSSIMSNLVTVAQSSSLGLISSPKDIYNMGGFPDTSDLSKLIVNTDGFTWHTNNCKFNLQANTNAYHNGRASQILFQVEANDLDIGDIKVEADTIARDGDERQGVQAYWFRNSTRNTRNNKIGSVNGNRLISCVVATSTDPANFRLRSLEHGDLFNNSGYYCLNCTENGDGITGTLTSNDCIRTYFCYGIRGHDETINTYNHLRFSDIVISRFSNDTSDINLKYTCHSSATSSGVISFEHINDDSDSSISNVKIDFGVTVSNPANPSINFKSFTAAGAVESTTSKRFSEIRLKGETNSTTPLDLATTIIGQTENSIYIERDELIRQQDTQGFNFIVGKNRIAFSDADGGMSCRFNVSDLVLTPSWGKLTVFATNNRVSFDDTYIIRDYYFAISVSNSGAVTVLNTTQISEVLQDALSLSPTITFPAQSAGSYQFVASVNNYTGANRIARCSLELFSGQSPF